MSESDRECAVCGDDVIFATQTLPADWESYLREKRDWRPVTSVMVPLCRSCYPEYDRLKSAGYSPVSADDDRVQEILDSISTESVELSGWD